MRRTVIMLAVVAAAAYVWGKRVQRPGRRHLTPYQRAALAWTDPRVTRARRAVKRARRGR